MKEKTKKEICLIIEDFNSVLDENQLEMYKNQVSKLDNKEKIKIDSLEYWETYKLGVEYIIKILNDNDKSIKILEDQIIRCKSRKENNPKLLTLISMTISIFALLISLAKNSDVLYPFGFEIFFVLSCIIFYVFYEIKSEEILKNNYKIHIFKNKIIELREQLNEQ